jgi:hypothetical protein
VTASYTATLQDTLRAIREALPPDKPAVDIQKILSTQEHWTTEMAHQLESLTEHFEKMEDAQRESEAGERFSEDDIQGTHYHSSIARALRPLKRLSRDDA